jgi:hypothetical protein
VGERVSEAFWVLPIFSDGVRNQLHGVWVTMAFCFWKVFSVFSLRERLMIVSFGFLFLRRNFI